MFGVAAGYLLITGLGIRHSYAAVAACHPAGSAVCRQAPALTTTSPNTPAATWLISQGWTHNGQPASLSMINQALHAIDVQAVTLQIFQPGPATRPLSIPWSTSSSTATQLLTIYQPDSRYRPFQWIEGGWLLALSLLLLAATVLLVRRRAT